LIPRTIHHIWVGPDRLPNEHRAWVKSWRRHHPDWEHRLWTEEDLPEDPIRPEVLERLRAPVERSDILRLELLYRYGGVYVDTDLECLRPLDGLLDGEDFVGVCLKPGRVTNTFIAAAPGHPLLERALEEVRPMDVYLTSSAADSIKDVAGPPMLRRLVAEFPDVKLIEPPVFFPSTPEEQEQAVAFHHMARSWHTETTMRAAMLRAEKRLEKAKAKLEEERRAHGATKERLERLERERRKESRGPKAERREKRAWLRRSG
jgi:mannosyltransferase OCH1-like enzyme